jgi:hypothetical protein
MDAGWQISVGDFTEALRPALFALAALTSAVVLYDARRRHLPTAHVAAWTLATLILPHVFLPLYLAVRLLARKHARDEESNAGENDETESVGTESVDAGSVEGESVAAENVAVETIAVETDEGVGDARRGAFGWRGWVLPLVYLTALASLGVVYFAREWRDFDARFARAKQAKLYGDRERTLREYRAALELHDDAHTRKLLALELLEAGRAAEALAELRAAGVAGEPDESLAFDEARALDALSRRQEAAAAYSLFLNGPLCADPAADSRCEMARARLQAP